VTLDVTKPDSIAAALEASGPIDVLVNNAGIWLFGAFEATPMATAREVFETNPFGVMAMTQAVLPQFRARRSGLVVNVTSARRWRRCRWWLCTPPARWPSKGSLRRSRSNSRHSTCAKLVEPGYGPTTRFTSNTGPRMEELIPEAYAPFAERIFASFAQPAAVTTEPDVAEVVWRAAKDATGQLRFPAGADAVALAR
jgi:NAD(P)-dependent dehydrogenase (short-subunit alcohol dehydrogenase family)